MAFLNRMCFLLPRLPGGLLLLVAMGGCSHPLEIDVPANMHGRVTIMCDTFDSAAPPIRVNEEGVAQHAVCPPSVRSLVVVRGGLPVRPFASPQWSTTGDGILLAVEFDLP